MATNTQTFVFDAYGTLLDVNAAVKKEIASFGETGEAFAGLWRTRQLEYCWTRTLMNRYANFWAVTEEALDYALRSFNLDQDRKLRERLLKSYFELSAHPDARDALRLLKAKGARLAVLSNGTNDMLQAALEAGGLLEYMDAVLSVDDLKIYKPDPRVYQYVCDRLDVTPEKVVFVSSNSWDLAGGSSFGFKVARINRTGGAREYEFADFHSEHRSLVELAELAQ
ncbi:haloacid dehalogenase type II [Paraburkholderia oxyphila]|uniref:haloacid dehalogenase type II n=1 Tax=Paraburkholderia oxyphila TaxID=614212 RepID=UPI000488E046|nr:haloacid dehalogenase type II [Paraburkholderia oxyphila]